MGGLSTSGGLPPPLAAASWPADFDCCSGQKRPCCAVPCCLPSRPEAASTDRAVSRQGRGDHAQAGARLAVLTLPNPNNPPHPRLPVPTIL